MIDLMLDRFNELVKISNSVPKLRDIILQLAVQGRLTEDWRRKHPEVEPASVLLEKIQKERNRLEKEGKIKKQKSLPDITEEEIPFEVPESWEWVRLGNIATVKGGKRLPKGHSFSETNSNHRYITVQNMKDNTIIEKPSYFISEDTFKHIENYILTFEDLYITIAGTIGRVGEVPLQFSGSNLTENAAKIRPLFINHRYSVLLLSSKTTQNYFRKATNQQAQPKLALRRIKETPFLMPPLEEQQEIVNHVDRLMELCDQLEEKQKEEDSFRVHSLKSSCYYLGDTNGDYSYNGLWKWFNPKMPELISTSDDVKGLRDTVLQLAVQGRLTEDWREENPDVEPASVLLEKIQNEKQRLKKEGKIKKLKPLPDITEEEIPFEVPESWEWVRLEYITTIIMGNSPPGYSYNKEKIGVPLINGPVEFGKGDFGHTVIKQYTTTPNKMCKKGDILICVRASTGRLNIASFDACIGRGVAAIRQIEPVSKKLLHLFLLNLRDSVVSKGKGTTFSAIKSNDLTNMLFPFPPYNEQQEIVNRVDRLMGLCDQLEENLSQAKEIGTKTWESIAVNV